LAVVELFLRNFVQLFLVILWLMVLGRALLSWVDPTGRNQVSAFLIQTTEPILAPVRRLLPQSSMIDFSPLIVLLILGALMRAF
jgi:YggT family protein